MVEGVVALEGRLARVAATLLGEQLKTASSSERAKDSYGRGYILGFCDAILLTQGINDEGRYQSFRSGVFSELFGEKEGERLARLALKEIEDESSAWAQTRGAQDYLHWRERALADEERPEPPTGLSSHIGG